MNYYFAKTLDLSFDETVNKLKNAMQPEGFGVVTEMNVQEKISEKLDIDFKPYIILGACNPKFAYKALMVEDKLGTMLPCNFMIQKISDNTTEIAAINPQVAMQSVKNPKLEAFAMEISDIIKRIMDKL